MWCLYLLLFVFFLVFDKSYNDYYITLYTCTKLRWHVSITRNSSNMWTLRLPNLTVLLTICYVIVLSAVSSLMPNYLNGIRLLIWMEFIHILIAMSKVIKTHCFILLTDLDRGTILDHTKIYFGLVCF